ncbi:glutathione S-transferase family protein [Halopseudomonas maritima]|uniref:glutathione S-transferase family protein n=1 Tax=Halopseudomonas maritima TaxID=2918528 RepID=UPI001EE9CFEB|nr:glutathione S-transferase family protein [Halopseudomonas maritima]UJJ31696.1 glutathione S-transferase family protein [Halopseudomonas maritima]
MTAAPYRLYGASHSLYTGKVRCYMRNQGIDYVELPTWHPDFAARILPQIGRGIIPVLETPEGRVIQDSIDIIDYLEAQGVPWPVYPQSPLLHILAIIIEYYGCQAMLKHAMHYRWSYREEQEDFLRCAFTLGSGAEMAEQIMGRMNSYLPRLGVNPGSIEQIETSYHELLALLDAHFAQMPYLLGSRPSIADYGLIAPLFAHLGRDPVPLALMQQRAPRVHRWVERMTAPGLDCVEYPEQVPAFLDDGPLPATLQALLRHISGEIFPELTDKLAFMDAWVSEQQPADGSPVTTRPQVRQIGLVQTQFRGAAIEVGVEPYLLYVLQRGTAVLDAQPADQQQTLLATLDQLGLSAALPRGRSYQVGRRNNLECWLRA